jgi:hypothetical protein
VYKCAAFIICEDLKQVRHLTINGVLKKMDFSGFRKEECRVRRLELFDCEKRTSFQELNKIPYLKIVAPELPLNSLKGLGGEKNKIIIIEEKNGWKADRFFADNYSKTYYKGTVLVKFP